MASPFKDEFFVKYGFNLTDEIVFEIIVACFALQDKTYINLSDINPIFVNFPVKIDNNLVFYNMSSNVVNSIKKDYIDFTIYIREKVKELYSKE